MIERVQLILIGTKTPSGSKAWWATVGTDKYVQSNELFKFWKIPQMILDRGGGGLPWTFKQGNEGGHIFPKKKKLLHL